MTEADKHIKTILPLSPPTAALLEVQYTDCRLVWRTSTNFLATSEALSRGAGLFVDTLMSGSTNIDITTKMCSKRVRGGSLQQLVSVAERGQVGRLVVCFFYLFVFFFIFLFDINWLGGRS